MAVKNVLPKAEHRNCTRHIFVDWNWRRYPKTYEYAFWRIAKSTTEKQWEDNFKALRQLDDAAATDLMSKSPK